MFSKEAIRALHGWAHESLDVLFAHVAALPAEDLIRAVEGFGHSSVRDQLVHMVFVEEVWVRLLQGLEVERWKEEFGSVAEIVRAKRRVSAETLSYIDGLSESDLNTPITPMAQWTGPARSPAFIIQHTLTHAFHHKGQVVAMCRLLGHPAPDTDLQRGDP